jgi:hypothetical protein
MTLNINTIQFHNYNMEENVSITLHEEGYNFMPKMTQSMPMGAGEDLHYGIDTDTGLVSFGIWMHDEDERPGHGGYWSSRAGVVGPKLGLQLVNIAINRMSVHITVDALEEILRQQGLACKYEVRSHYDGEFTYRVHKTVTTKGIGGATA